MARNEFRALLLSSMRDPWTLLLSTFGGATAWAFGASIPLAAATTFVMLGTAAAFGALTRIRHETPTRLRGGTRQQELLCLLDAQRHHATRCCS